MKAKIWIPIVILIVVVAGVAVYQFIKPVDKVVQGDASYEVEASAFFNEFNEDESKANAKYLNKIVSVQGKVADVSVVDSVGVNIVLESGSPLFGVSCQVPEGKDKRTVNVGDRVRIKGLCTGKLMDVVLIRCVIEDRINDK